MRRASSRSTWASSALAGAGSASASCCSRVLLRQRRSDDGTPAQLLKAWKVRWGPAVGGWGRSLWVVSKELVPSRGVRRAGCIAASSNYPLQPDDAKGFSPVSLGTTVTYFGVEGCFIQALDG